MGQSKARNFMGYTWTVIVNIFTIFVVLAIYNSIYGSFETIMVSIGILIYLNLNSFSSIWGWHKQKELFALNEEFKKLRKLLKENVDKDVEEYENEELENNKNIFNKQQVKFYINSGFAFLIYLITLFHLFGTL